MKALNLSVLTLLMLYGLGMKAQTILSLDSAISLALANHPLIKFSQQEIAQKEAQKGGSFNLQNPQVIVQATYTPKYTIGVQQNLDNPVVYIQQSKYYQQNINTAKQSAIVNRNTLITEVKLTYLNLQYVKLMVEQLSYRDSLSKLLHASVERHFLAGNVSMLEKVSTEAEWRKINNLLAQAKTDLFNAQVQLQLIIGFGDPNLMTADNLNKIIYVPTLQDSSALRESPVLGLYQQNVLLAESNLKLQKSKIAPGVIVGYLNQTGDNVPLQYRFQAGLSVPVWFWTYRAQIKSAKYEYEMKQSEFAGATIDVNSSYQQALNDVLKYQQSLSYYEASALPQAEIIISTAKRSYEAGEINYMLYLQSLNQAFEIKMSYHESLKNYNQSVIQLNSITGQQ